MFSKDSIRNHPEYIKARELAQEKWNEMRKISQYLSHDMVENFVVDSMGLWCNGSTMDF